MRKQLCGNGQGSFAVLAVFGQIPEDLYFIKPQAGAEFHLVLTGAIQHAFGILKLVMVEEYLSRKKIRLVMTRINVDGAIVIIYYLLAFSQLIRSFLALHVSRIITAVFLDHLIAGINTVFIFLALKEQVSFVLHGCKLVTQVLGNRDCCFHIFHGKLLFLQFVITSAEQVTGLKFS